jgi:hypothetical protein
LLDHSKNPWKYDLNIKCIQTLGRKTTTLEEDNEEDFDLHPPQVKYYRHL